MKRIRFRSDVVVYKTQLVTLIRNFTCAGGVQSFSGKMTTLTKTSPLRAHTSLDIVSPVADASSRFTEVIPSHLVCEIEL